MSLMPSFFLFGSERRALRSFKQWQEGIRDIHLQLYSIDPGSYGRARYPKSRKADKKKT